MKKKSLRKVLAASVAAMLMCAPMMGINSVFAEGNEYAVTVETPAGDAARTYEAYQIFSGVVTTKTVGTGTVNVLSNLQWNTAVVDTTGLFADIAASDILKNKLNSTMNMDALSTALSSFTDDSKEAIEFARLVSYNIKSDAASTNVSGTDSKLPAGYYLLKDSTSNGVASLSRGLLAVSGPMTITPKTSAPTLNKVIDEGSGVTANTALIGEDVPYKLTSAVPDMTGYNKYFFIINDTLSDGFSLNYDAKKSVRNAKDVDENPTGKGFTVTVGGTVLEDVTDKDGDTDETAYTTDEVAYYVVQNGNSFKIVFTNFEKNTAGKPITVTYSAKLTEDATYATTTNSTDPLPNKNTANLTYSSDPNVEYKGIYNDNGTPNDPSDDTVKPFEPDDNGTPDNPTDDKEPTKDTQDKTVYTYTTKFILNKKAETADGDPLAGVKFKLVGTTNGYSYETTTNAEGKIEFTGLEAGTYTLSETGKLTGYNDIDDITITIGADLTDNNCVWSYQRDSAAASSSNETIVVNKSGLTLPTTGGIGTTLFYVTGGFLVLGSAVLLVTKKRMTLKDDK